MASDPIHTRIVAIKSSQPHLTHAQIGDLVGRSKRTVGRVLEDQADLVETLSETFLNALQEHLDTLQSSEDTALNYVELATSAKNEAVRLGAQQRIDDLRGIVTQKELVRTRRDEQAQPQPMFIMPPGTSVNVTIHQGKTTTSSDDLLSNGAIDVKSLETQGE